MSTTRYAFWYEPTGEVYSYLKSLIIQLSAKYNSPIFEPHITLLPGGTDLDKESVINKLRVAISESNPFETKLTTYDYLDDFFKCIFLRVDKSSSVMNFCSSIQTAFNSQPTTDFTPHLSVLYGQIANEEKEKIISRLGMEYQKSFIIEKVDIIEYKMGEPPETWKKIESILVK